MVQGDRSPGVRGVADAAGEPQPERETEQMPPQPKELCDAVMFLELGAIPVAEFTGGLVETKGRGEVVLDERGARSRPGIYAADDVTDGPGKQVIIGAGEGAPATVAASQDLKRRPGPGSGPAASGSKD